MTENNIEILLLQGFNTFKFKSTPEEAELIFGKPEETQVLEDDILDSSSYVMHYWSIGTSLFFDQKRNNVFTCAEVDNADALLFGERLFDLTEKQLIELMKQHGFPLTETEQHEWGERRVSFDEAGLDCYFENNRLQSINFGIIDATGEFHYFPN